MQTPVPRIHCIRNTLPLRCSSAPGHPLFRLRRNSPYSGTNKPVFGTKLIARNRELAKILNMIVCLCLTLKNKVSCIYYTRNNGVRPALQGCESRLVSTADCTPLAEACFECIICKDTNLLQIIYIIQGETYVYT